MNPDEKGVMVPFRDHFPPIIGSRKLKVVSSWMINYFAMKRYVENTKQRIQS